MALDSIDRWDCEQEMLLASTVWILSSGTQPSMQPGKRCRFMHSRQGLFTR